MNWGCLPSGTWRKRAGTEGGSKLDRAGSGVVAQKATEAVLAVDPACRRRAFVASFNRKRPLFAAAQS